MTQSGRWELVDLSQWHGDRRLDPDLDVEAAALETMLAKLPPAIVQQLGEFHSSNEPLTKMSDRSVPRPEKADSAPRIADPNNWLTDRIENSVQL
jgi:hypothetical protein